MFFGTQCRFQGKICRLGTAQVRYR